MTQADLDTLSIDEQIETMWRRGENTYDIAQAITRFLGHPFSEAHVCRVLHSVRDERAKGGAQ